MSSFIRCSRCSLQLADTDENADYFFGFSTRTGKRLKNCRRCRTVQKEGKEKRKKKSSSSSSEESNDTEESGVTTTAATGEAEVEELFQSAEEEDDYTGELTNIFVGRAKDVDAILTKKDFLEALNDGRVMMIKVRAE